MDVSVNYLAVLLAALASIVVGMVWYSPAVFYRQWADMVHLKTDSKPDGTKKPFLYGTVFLASYITAHALAYIAFLSNQYFQNNFWQDALTTAFWLWLAIVAARIYVHDSFEARPPALTAITVGHELVTLVVMALIIGAMGY